jgi:hypothetical protein
VQLWASVDPLAEKYPNRSPYEYCFSSPINVIDPDGRDGIRIVDQKNKTITIKAVYYVQTEKSNYYTITGRTKQLDGYSVKDITKKQEDINNYLNGLKNNTVTEGKYKGYTVKYDLQFKVGGTGEQAKEKASKEKYEGFPIGNTLEVTNGTANKYFAKKEIDNGDGTTTTSVVGGITEDKKHILMNSSEDGLMNTIHEIFHTFGFTHPKGFGGGQGIMNYPPKEPSQKDTNQISKDEFLPVLPDSKKDVKQD